MRSGIAATRDATEGSDPTIRPTSHNRRLCLIAIMRTFALSEELVVRGIAGCRSVGCDHCYDH
jgi:hypothetical protein